MEAPPLNCTNCSTPLPNTFLNSAQDQFQPCPVCGDQLRTVVFPALLRQPAQADFGERILVDGEASCFYHPTKRADIPCEECGRFLCPVCNIDFNGRHICPACLEGDRQKPGQRSDFENNRILYDSMALSIVLVSFCMGPLCVFTSPIAVVLAIFSWSRPSSLIPRTRIRAILAIFIGLLQTGGAIALIIRGLSQ